MGETMEEGDVKTQQFQLNKYALSCSMVISLISIIFGYDTGVMSGAMIFIEDDLEINDIQVSVLAGILNLCALVGSLIAGRVSDYIGRRYTIVLAASIFLIGSVLMGYGPTYAILLMGRCIAGIGVGFALMIAPVYTAEISPPSSRGFLTSLPDIAISFGILLGYVSNYFFAKLDLRLGWRLMLGVAAIPSLGLAFGIRYMPESPRWLAMQGRLGEAKKVLFKISNSEEDAESRFRDIKTVAGVDENCDEDVVKLPKAAQGKSVWKELLLAPSPSVRRILLAAIGLHFFDHATGIEAVVLYSPRIFKKAGVVNKNKLLLATVGVGLTKTLFIFVATFLLDKVGRRMLLLVGTIGMVVALLVLGSALTVAEHSKEKLMWALVLSICAVYTFVAFFSMGMGPIAWVYLSEIFPLRVRALGVGIGVGVNRVMNAAVSMSFISIYKAITIGGAFFMFAGFGVLSLVFIYFFLPETKGKSLEEIEMLFGKTERERSIEATTHEPRSNPHK
ncbi:putative polyol transporter 6 [Morella rubra]|uniref:Putative polyol transporter 6 n=1 Tax=Morella rubra TaxID=262757 RepID=A0A6A1VNX6_9ROSI|nr:putative polyol transporter 6 [Morella rubra]KAB1226174.1 putative polyol transporter 6 [Morella rubra]